MPGMSDGLDELRAKIAAEHLGDSRLGVRLSGGNARQLRLDAERLRAEAGLDDYQGRPSMQAELFRYKQKRGRDFQRVFGREPR
jgi:hypothetical protein